MSEDKKLKKDILTDAPDRIVGFLFFLVIVFLAGIAMFGDQHRANENDLKVTKKHREHLEFFTDILSSE